PSTNLFLEPSPWNPSPPSGSSEVGAAPEGAARAVDAEPDPALVVADVEVPAARVDHGLDDLHQLAPPQLPELAPRAAPRLPSLHVLLVLLRGEVGDEAAFSVDLDPVRTGCLAHQQVLDDRVTPVAVLHDDGCSTASSVACLFPAPRWRRPAAPFLSRRGGCRGVNWTP